jgi:hypothetical protein
MDAKPVLAKLTRREIKAVGLMGSDFAHHRIGRSAQKVRRLK